jgi:hypothetical protein
LRPRVRNVDRRRLMADTASMPTLTPRSAGRASQVALLAAALALAGCGSDDHPTAPPPPRTYRMGFTQLPPSPDPILAFQALEMWTRRADAGLILGEPPWDSLLAGRPADALARGDALALATYYRSKGLRVWVSVDPTNGLDRSSDAAPLVAAGRSLVEPGVQQLYRAWVSAIDTLLRPDYLGVASETNLVRAAAPAALYAAVVQAANDAAADVRAVDPAARLFSTVQVEVAWGRLGGPGGFEGIAQDRADFPFMDALGLSSYPYLGGFSDPSDLPLDYYTRLVQGAPIPVMVIEGGWTSESVGGVTSSPDVQRRYVARHARLLDEARAVAWFPILFADLDLTAIPLPPGSILPLFAHLGVVDEHLAPKPALSAWDAEHRRPFAP